MLQALAPRAVRETRVAEAAQQAPTDAPAEAEPPPANDRDAPRASPETMDPPTSVARARMRQLQRGQSKAAARMAREAFDAMLCDVSMPGEDGLALVRRLRAAERDATARLPTAAMSANAGRDDRRAALLAGFDLHVPKPLRPAEVLQAVRDLVDGKREKAE